MSPAAQTRLEKAAADNGFDLGGSHQADWISFRSSHSPLRIWLRVQEGGILIAALSRSNVLAALDGFGALISDALPNGACGARSVADFPTPASAGAQSVPIIAHASRRIAPGIPITDRHSTPFNRSGTFHHSTRWPGYFSPWITGVLG